MDRKRSRASAARSRPSRLMEPSSLNIAGQAGRLLALKNAVDSSVLLHLIDIQADGIGADVDNSVHASSPLWLRSARKRDRII